MKFHMQAEVGDAGLADADVEEADMASSEEGDVDEEEEDSSGQTKVHPYFFLQSSSKTLTPFLI